MHPFFLTLLPEAILLAHTAYRTYFPADNSVPGNPEQLISKPSNNKQQLQNLIQLQKKKDQLNK